MSFPISVVADVGLTLQMTVERVSDGYYWQRVQQTWALSPTFADRTLPMTAGTLENSGSYVGPVANLSSQGDPGLVRIRVHSATDPVPNLVIAVVEGYVKNSLLCSIDDFLSTRASPAQVSTEVRNVLTSSAVLEIDELTQVPPRKPTIAQCLALIYTVFRNKVFSNATVVRFYNDAGGIIFEAPIVPGENNSTRDKLQNVA